MVNELLRKHFAVLGTTGSGKSCAVSLLLSAILADYPMAHTILIDPHNEYGRVFGRTAEVINIDNLQLPFWFFRFRGGGRDTGPRGYRSGAGSSSTDSKRCHYPRAPTLRGREPRCDNTERGYADAVSGIRSRSFHLRGDG